MTMQALHGAVETVLQLLQSAESTYYRLVLLVGRPGTGKTATLCAVAEKLNCPVVNASLELSGKLLPMTIRQRALRLPETLTDVVVSANKAVILDRTEILFDKSLQQDPLKLLQHISRNRQVVAAWDGVLEDGKLIYAEPDHIEYRQYPISDFFVVDLNTCL